MLWQTVTVANVAISIAYFAISWIIFSGLRATDQLWTNRLATATSLIFFTCAVHHGSHAIHMLLPAIGLDEEHGRIMREAWDWHTVGWDLLTASVGIYYLSLRGSYASVLRGAQMFEDLKVRERQALEINDNIVQGLTVAKYALTMGADDQSKQAIEDTLRRARSIITDLLGDPGSGMELGPGDLRRSEPAVIADAEPPGP